MTPALEVLSQEQCEDLLRSKTVGRVAVVADGRPRIFPVNYRFAERAVVFRTASGFKLQHSPMTVVAFEIDEVDEQDGIAWSVVVEGTAEVITTAIDTRSLRLRRLAVEPLAPGAHPEWVAIHVESMSGRRFRVGVAADVT